MNEHISLVECQNLSKDYGKHAALQCLNLTLERGKIIGLLGPNGSGKTTFIKLLCGILQPTTGTVKIAGNIPGIITHSMTSYLPDRMYLNDWMTVRDLLDFFTDFYSDFDGVKAKDMLKALNISDSERLRTLSKGTQEKVQLIVTMARQSQLYLLDEPIGGVDPAARDYILKTILTNYSENASVLISTHLISDIERVLDDTVILKNGVLYCHDSVDNIREKEGLGLDAYFRKVFAAGNEYDGEIGEGAK